MTTPSQFVYVTYIRTTPQRLWDALTDPVMMKDYWVGMHCESEWKAGSSWRLLFSDGRVADAGEIVESDPPRRLVIKWRNEFKPEMKAEGYSRCEFEIEPVEGVVKLTVSHGMDRPGTAFVGAVSGGWPLILSNLKSLLETGAVALKDRP